jgi:hypothetical protein
MSEKKISKKCNQRSPDQELRRRGRKEELSNLRIEGHAARLVGIFFACAPGEGTLRFFATRIYKRYVEYNARLGRLQKSIRKNGGHGWLGGVKLKWSGGNCSEDHEGISPRHPPSCFLPVSNALRIVSNNSSG